MVSSSKGPVGNKQDKGIAEHHLAQPSALGRACLTRELFGARYRPGQCLDLRAVAAEYQLDPAKETLNENTVCDVFLSKQDESSSCFPVSAKTQK